MHVQSLDRIGQLKKRGSQPVQIAGRSAERSLFAGWRSRYEFRGGRRGLIDGHRSGPVAAGPSEVSRERASFDQFHGEEPLYPIGMHIEQSNEIRMADVL